MSPTLDIVICCYDRNRLSQVRTCLTAVTAEVRGDDRVIVVVDHCQELLADLREDTVNGLGAAEVVVCWNTRDRGSPVLGTVGSPTGPIRSSASSMTMPYPFPAGRSRFVEAFSEPEVAAVGGRVRPRFTGTDGGIVPRPRWVPESCDWVFGCDYAGGPSDGALIRNPIGAAMAVRREILDEGEGFRSGVGRLGADCAGGEETELFQRLTAGHPERQVRKKDAFRVLHSVPPSRVCLRYVLRRSFMEGRSKAALSALSYTALGAERDHLDRAATGVGGELRRLVHGDLSAVLRLATGAGVILAAGTGFLIGRRIPDVVSTGDAAVPETGGGTGRPEVSVVLCTDGRGRRLGDALAAVAAAGRVAASRCPVEILLVDNSGSGDCAEIPEVKEILAEGAPVRVVRAPVRGLSRARNVGPACGPRQDDRIHR